MRNKRSVQNMRENNENAQQNLRIEKWTMVPFFQHLREERVFALHLFPKPQIHSFLIFVNSNTIYFLFYFFFFNTMVNGQWSMVNIIVRLTFLQLRIFGHSLFILFRNLFKRKPSLEWTQ